MPCRRKVTAKEKPLKGSGSYPVIAKSKPSKTLIRGFFSSTNLLAGRRMKRFSGGSNGLRKGCDLPGRSLKSQRLKQQQPTRRNGDIFDFLPKRCVQVTPLVATLMKNEDFPGRKIYGSKRKVREYSTGTSSSACTPGTGVKNRHIDVIVRIRPKNIVEERTKTVVWRTTDTTLVFDPKEKNSDFYFKGKKQYVRNDFGRKRPNKDLAFAFDYVYGPDSSNKEVFDVSLKGLLDQVLDGFNCTIFAYGATGSGKTYTMLGSNDTPGITVLMAEELYRRLETMSEEYITEVSVSYLEVYNETIKDLLKPEKELYIREDGKKGIIIPELTNHRPRGAQELLKLLKSGNNARSQHATDLNAESSRSHAVFQILVLLRQKSESDPFKVKTSTSKLFMVDLAGSERGITNGLDGLRQREGANINKSLLALSNCINALADGKPHIPFRNSKLTRLLKDSLSGNCVTIMIANVSPSEITFEDTHNTLHYANRAKHIQISCKQNFFSEELVEESTKVQISELQDQIRFLTNQLEEQRQKQIPNEEKPINHQMGTGDCANLNLLSPLVSDIFLERPLSVINNPVAVDHFLELMRKRNKFMASFTEASVDTRLHEWEMNWNKVKVDVADFLGKLDVSDPHFIAVAKLKNMQSNLAARYPKVMSTVDENKNRLTFINDEIENIYQKYLKTLKLDQPFLTVTFQEFMNHKKLETDIVTSEKLHQFYHHLCDIICSELVHTEVHLIHSMKFIQLLQNQLRDNKLLTPELEENFHTILAPAYGCGENLQPPNQLGRKFSIRDDINNLKKIITQPVLILPKNEPALDASSMTIFKGEESSEISLTDPNRICHDTTETSCKDTYDDSSGDEKQYGVAKSLEETVQYTHNELHAPNTASDSTSSTDLNSIEAFSDSSENEQLSESKNFPQANIKTKKKLGSKTSRVSPGSSYLRNESIDVDGIGPFQSDDGTGTEMEINRTKSKSIHLHSGRAMTDITEAVKFHKTIGSQGLSYQPCPVFDNKVVEGRIIAKPPIKPLQMAHPFQERDHHHPQKWFHGGRPYTFMYKDSTSSSTDQ